MNINNKQLFYNSKLINQVTAQLEREIETQRSLGIIFVKGINVWTIYWNYSPVSLDEKKLG